MKMKKSLVALCLSAGLLASVPGISLADVNYVPQNTSAAPAIPAAALQQLVWTPVESYLNLCGEVNLAVTLDIYMNILIRIIQIIRVSGH